MKKALVVIDMQNDFVDGSLGTKEAVEILPAVKARIEEGLQGGEKLFFTLDTHSENYLDSKEGKNLPVIHCVKGTKGWEITPSLKPYLNQAEKVFEKPTFGSVELAEYLKNQKFDEIQLLGICTDICVVSNALLIKANIPEASISVFEKGMAGVTPETHRSALETMKMCQIAVV